MPFFWVPIIFIVSPDLSISLSTSVPSGHYAFPAFVDTGLQLISVHQVQGPAITQLALLKPGFVTCTRAFVTWSFPLIGPWSSALRHLCSSGVFVLWNVTHT